MPFIGRPNSICSFPKQWTNFPPSFLSTPCPSTSIPALPISVPSHPLPRLTSRYLPSHRWSPSPSPSQSLAVCIFLLTLCCLSSFYRLLTDHAPPFLSSFLHLPHTQTLRLPTTPGPNDFTFPSGKYWRP
ncbi:hypothetical protein CSPX01_13042 [Colletotrichum filicis]|nr:hypothetical protein CSPX01_13042 [Colletotrichum filicis]